MKKTLCILKSFLHDSSSLIMSSLLLLLLSSCHNNDVHKAKLQIKCDNMQPQEIKIKNYSKALFSLDTANFAEGLKMIQKDYHVFLNGDIDNPKVVSYLKDFVTDTFCIGINAMAEKKFSDTKQLAKDIKSVCQHFHYYYPDVRLPEETYVYVSGIDYEIPPVMVYDEGILVSCDYYLGNDDNIYDYIGMPRFRSMRCQPAYISRDLAESIYSSYVNIDRRQKDVLTEMVNIGKKLYFIEAMNPAMHDSVLMGYSSKQIQWAENYEADVWASIVGNNMLYSNSMDAFRTFFGDAPFTQAFSNEAPARLGEYIGLQIIRSYMTNNDVSLRDMMDDKDVQRIFQMSQYKPRKK